MHLTQVPARSRTRSRRIAGASLVVLALVAGSTGADSPAGAATRRTTKKKVVRRTVTTKAAFVPPPTTAAPAPVPLPPVTVAPTTLPVPTTAAVRNYAIAFDVASVTVRPGETAAIPLSITRAGWTGPVDLSVVDTNSGLTANLAPNPTTASTVLYVQTKSTTASGDYRVAVVGFVGNTVRYAEALVRVRGAESIVATHITTALTIPRGNAGHIYGNFQVINSYDGSRPSISISGMPSSSIVISSITWAANGDVDVAIYATASAPPGTYSATLEATRPGTNQGLVVLITIT